LRSSNGGATTKKKNNSKIAEEENDAMDDFFLDEDQGTLQNHAADDEEPEDLETADEKRVRLAKEFLMKMQKIEDSDGEEGDSAAVHQRLKSELLKAEGKYETAIAEELTDLNPETVKVLRGLHRFSITDLVNSPDDRFVFSASKDGIVTQFDTETGQRVRTIRRVGDLAHGHTSDVYSLALHPSNPSVLASGGKDKTVKIWDVRMEENANQVDPCRGFGRYRHSGTVTGLKFRDAEALELISVSSDRQLKIWNCTAMAYVDTLFGHQAEISCLDTLTSSAETALTASADGSARIWKITEESQLVFMDNPKLGNMPIDCCFMMNSTNFITGGQDGTLNLWSKAKKRPMYQVQSAHSSANGGESGWISSVAGVRYSDLCASGSNNGLVQLWKLSSSNKNKLDANKLLPLGSIPIPGFCNAMSFGNSNPRLLFIGIGRDHGFGRWNTIQNAKNGVHIIKLSSN
jgi:ribosomal RNA-processing protein 9